MDVEFFVCGLFMIIVLLGIFCVYGILFEWLPEYLRQRRATAAERATEWVNSHPIKPRARKIR